MHCIYCGKKIDNQAIFCNHCGKKTSENRPKNDQTTLDMPVNNVFRNQQENGREFVYNPKPKKSRKGLKLAFIGVFLFACIIIISIVGVKFLRNNSFFQGKETFIATNERIEKDLGKAEFVEVDPDTLIATETWGEIPSNQIYFMLEDTNPEQAEQIASDIAGELVGEMSLINLYQVQVSDLSEKEMLSLVEYLSNIEGVESAFPNIPIKQEDVDGTSCTPLKDPMFQEGDNGKHYEIIGMAEAWQIIKGSQIPLNNVFVGVLDSAIYTGSPEFKGKVNVTGDTTTVADIVPDGQDGFEKNGHYNHGTMVTHVIGADYENSGMVGVASVLEDQLNIKVIDSRKPISGNLSKEESEMDEEDVIHVTDEMNGQAYVVRSLLNLKKMVESGQTVINCSFGPEFPREGNAWITKAYKKFFEAVYKKYPDVVFVAAAGNEGLDSVSKGKLTGENYFPGGIPAPNVITVGAINNDGSRANFSNYAAEDSEVTLSAPGVDMVLGIDLTGNTEDPTGEPVKSSGTSFATPQVTATIALMQSINPDLKAKDIKKILIATAAKGVTTGNQSIPIPAGMGAGVLRVDDAVLMVINDLREEEGLEPFDKEFLLDSSRVELFAEGSSDKYTLTAKIQEASSKHVEVKIEVSGDHSLDGKLTQSVSAGDEAEWNIILEDEEVFVKVIRLDNNGCSYLTLKPEEEEDEEEEVAEDELTLEAVISGTWELYAGFDQSGNRVNVNEGAFDGSTYTLTFNAEGGFSGIYKESSGYVNTSFSGTYDITDSKLADPNPFNWYYYCTIPRTSIVESGESTFPQRLPAEYGSNNPENVWLTFEFRELDGTQMLYDWAMGYYFKKR